MKRYYRRDSVALLVVLRVECDQGGCGTKYEQTGC